MAHTVWVFNHFVMYLFLPVLVCKDPDPAASWAYFCVSGGVHCACLDTAVGQN